MRAVIRPAEQPLQGSIRVPSDKSISHRAVLFAALAHGRSVVRDALDAADVRSSIEAVRALGAAVDISPGDCGLSLVIDGWGDRGPAAPPHPIDCGNSGTTARLLLGILAGYQVSVTLVGDRSLSGRPMRRVTEPLTRMGARFDLSPQGTLPVTVHGGPLVGCDHELTVASAQVKTALLLAGLRATGTTTVREPAPSRDHTERMLPVFGAQVEREDSLTVRVQGLQILRPAEVAVPADPSSAAFLAVAAALVPGSEVVLRDVCLNPTRIAFLDVMRRMGVDLSIAPGPDAGGEPVGDVTVRGGAPLRPADVPPHEVPALIDEVPVLAVLACAAHGATRFRSVGELRVKESDRLDATVHALHAMGAQARVEDDDLVVVGPANLHGAEFSSRGDHRLAMAFAVAGLVASGPVSIDGFEAVAVSYPRFSEDLHALVRG